MLGAAVVASGAAILSIEEIGPEAIQLRLLAAAALGIPLFVAVTLVAEQRRWTGLARLGPPLAVLALLAGFYAAWNGWSEAMRGLRFTQAAIAAHLMVASVPLALRSGDGAFWQYNRRLFVRVLACAIATGTLFAGLSIALFAIQKLFEVDVAGSAYARLWVVLAFVFNTWVFLGGLPADLARLEDEQAYPQALKIFAQYILVPLVSIYLVILTLYLAKVLVTRDWPSGWIGWLVSSVATAGILALLLVQPLAEREDQKWIAVFARDFWIAMLPAIVMLWLAIWKRVEQYGVTEPRYFLAVMSLWLFAMAVYFTLTRSRRIRVIPASLCVVALVTFAGPWSAYAVSQRSQVGRLRAVVTHARAAGRFTFDDDKQVSDIVRYLQEVHDARPLAPLLPDSARTRLARADRGEMAGRAIVKALGATWVDRWSRRPEVEMRFDFSSDSRRVVDVRGYDALLRLVQNDTAGRDSSLGARFSRDMHAVEVVRGGESLLSIPLDSLLASLPIREDANQHRPNAVLAPERLRAQVITPRGRATVYFRSLTGSFNPRGRRITAATGDVLVALAR